MVTTSLDYIQTSVLLNIMLHTLLIYRIQNLLFKYASYQEAYYAMSVKTFEIKVYSDRNVILS